MQHPPTPDDYQPTQAEVDEYSRTLGGDIRLHLVQAMLARHRVEQLEAAWPSIDSITDSELVHILGSIVERQSSMLERCLGLFGAITERQNTRTYSQRFLNDPLAAATAMRIEAEQATQERGPTVVRFTYRHPDSMEPINGELRFGQRWEIAPTGENSIDLLLTSVEQ